MTLHDSSADSCEFSGAFDRSLVRRQGGDWEAALYIIKRGMVKKESWPSQWRRKGCGKRLKCRAELQGGVLRCGKEWTVEKKVMRESERDLSRHIINQGES